MKRLYWNIRFIFHAVPYIVWYRRHRCKAVSPEGNRCIYTWTDHDKNPMTLHSDGRRGWEWG